MKQLVEFPLGGGGSVLVEVEEPEPEDGLVRAARRGEIEEASQNFEVALEKVRPAASAVISKLREMSESPDEIEMEFGLGLSAKAGAFIASAGTTANFKVTLTWRR